MTSIDYLVACAALTGCYFAGRPGVTAPIGHGHGGAGFDLGLAAGVEHRDNRLRAGGGVVFGPRLADGNGYVPFGVEGHVAVAVGGAIYDDPWRPMIVANAATGVGVGVSPSGDTGRPDSPSGYFAQAFVGAGLGSPTTQRSYGIRAGHIALGLSAIRFWPEPGDGFWMLGGALDLSFGWWEPR